MTSTADDVDDAAGKRERERGREFTECERVHVSAGKLSIRTRRRRRVRYVQNDLSSSFIDWSGSRIFATHTATHVRIMHPILIKRKGSGEQLSETEFECSDECARGIQASETHGRARRRNQLGIEAVGAAVPLCRRYARRTE